MARWYMVYSGQVPGVYEEWEDCQAQVTNFSGNCYKGYKTRELAVSKWRRHVWKKNRMKFLIMVPILLIVIAGVIYSFI
jgi:viroplasmin and RNaseH domain-containing protein